MVPLSNNSDYRTRVEGVERIIGGLHIPVSDITLLNFIANQ